MADAANVEEQLRRTVDRLKQLGLVDSFYLAGGTAIAFHFGHRHSRDLDFFSNTNAIDLNATKTKLLGSCKDASVLSETDVALHTLIGGVPVDFVKYAYPPFEKTPFQSVLGVTVASPIDLAVMKLAAISRRGLRRDFWDLYVIVKSGLTLKVMGQTYVRRFGVAESDLYHVLRALTYFDDAERDTTLPQGMTQQLWSEIKEFFLIEAPKLVVI